MRATVPLNIDTPDLQAPANDSALQEFRRSIDAGIAEARAGLGDDWQTVQARLRAQVPPCADE